MGDAARGKTSDDMDVDLGLDKLWFHDSTINRVVENAESKELAFEVMYPVDWDNNQFAPRTIVFRDVLRYLVAEGPFAGRPVILGVTQVGEQDDRAAVRVETNAGERMLLCKGVAICDGWAAAAADERRASCLQEAFATTLLNSGGDRRCSGRMRATGVRMSGNTYLDVTEENGRAFFSRGIAGPVVMLNLLRFRATADYSATPGLAPARPITGEAAYRLYMEHTLPFLEKSGGEVLFYGRGDRFLIGPADERWDAVLLVRQKGAAAFLAFASDRDYMKGIGHRTAALEDSRLLPLLETPA
ncbi:MAG TPA: hypothetical protein VFX78_07025 [Candidatus Eisenbacteria bacterium]|nr:hypothetical protein [Candidatus Eisenbacteria bacterium]